MQEQTEGVQKDVFVQLTPAAYSEAILPALRLARSSRLARITGKIMLWLLVLGFVVVAAAPWQQSVTGSGNVVAYAPYLRPQVIEAPIKGRVVRWGENVRENAKVEKGELIVEIRDIDPEYLSRLEAQVEASEAALRAAERVVEATERARDAASKAVESFENQVRAYTSAREQVIASADAAIESARNKVEAEQKQLEEYKASLEQIAADYERQKQLFEEKIVAAVKFQLAERKYLEMRAKVDRAKAYIETAKNDLQGKIADRDAKALKAKVDIDYAQSALEKARSDYAKAESDVAKAQSEVNKARKALLDAQAKEARQRNQSVVAPFSGFLTKVTPNQGGAILKEGDPLCTIVPDTPDRAVQLWLDGNDAPLVSPGRHVRLQFEGWPAVQFAGWPSVAVGTFGGTVVSVDATDNGKGKFRVLVRPDPESDPWPPVRYLRQGVRANGWVLLKQVPLWYEIWRQMNGFPPVITPDNQPDGGSDKSKSSKGLQ